MKLYREPTKGYLQNHCLSVVSLLMLSALALGCSSASTVDEVVAVDEMVNTPSENVQQTSDSQTTDQTTDTETTNPSTDTETLVDSTEEPAPVDLGEGNRAIERIAHLTLAQTQSPTKLDVTANARFYKLTNPLDEEPILRDHVVLDSCEISGAASQLNAEALDFPVDHLLGTTNNEPLQITPVAVGESIDISSVDGSFVSLVPDDTISNVGQYQMDAGAALNVEVPDELSIDIVGVDFPLQWDWVKPPALDTSLRDDVRNIRSNSILSWQAVEQTDNLRSRVMIYAGHINELNGAYQSFECTLADDGEFRVPENVRALYENGFSANFVDIVRYTRTRDLVEDISIVNVFVQKL